MSKKDRVSKFASIEERRNWGWWDGLAAGQRRKFPEWSKSYLYRSAHPFDKSYGEAFWAGWYGEPHPNTGKPGFDPEPSRAAWRSSKVRASQCRVNKQETIMADRP